MGTGMGMGTGTGAWPFSRWGAGLSLDAALALTFRAIRRPLAAPGA